MMRIQRVFGNIQYTHLDDEKTIKTKSIEHLMIFADFEPKANPNSRLIASRHSPNRNAHTTILLSSSTVAEQKKIKINEIVCDILPLHSSINKFGSLDNVIFITVV